MARRHQRDSHHEARSAARRQQHDESQYESGDSRLCHAMRGDDAAVLQKAQESDRREHRQEHEEWCKDDDVGNDREQDQRGNDALHDSETPRASAN